MTKAEIQQVKQRFGIIGNTEALSRAIDVAIQVAPTDLSVLITGESGVGKEVFHRSFINIAGESMGSILLSTVCHTGRYDRFRTVRTRERSIYRCYW